MVTIPAPKHITDLISRHATTLAKDYGSKKSWTSTRGLEAYSDNGVAGIRTPVPYLMYIERGTRPRLMRELEGKVIPIEPGRFVTAKGVGEPGWVTLPGNVKVWREEKWRHPGIKPHHFMINSLQESAKLYKKQLTSSFIRLITEGEFL